MSDDLPSSNPTLSQNKSYDLEKSQMNGLIVDLTVFLSAYIQNATLVGLRMKAI